MTIDKHQSVRRFIIEQPGLQAMTHGYPLIRDSV